MFSVVWKNYLNVIQVFLLTVLVSSSLITLVICRTLNEDDTSFKIRVLHTNDLHSRFDEVTLSGSKCKDRDRRKNVCVGGVARIKHEVDRIKNEHHPDDNVLFLNAGDFFQVCCKLL